MLRRLCVVCLLCLGLSAAWIEIGSAEDIAPAPTPVAENEALRGHFVEVRTLQGFSKPFKSSGTFVLVPRKGLIWDSQQPFKTTTVITPEGILQIVNGHEALRLSTTKYPGLDRLYDVLSAAVSGDDRPLKTAFDVQRQTGPDGWRISLVPLHSDSVAMGEIRSLTVVGRDFVESVIVRMLDGDQDDMAFSSQTVSHQNLSADESSLLGAFRR